MQKPKRTQGESFAFFYSFPNYRNDTTKLLSSIATPPHRKRTDAAWQNRAEPLFFLLKISEAVDCGRAKRVALDEGAWGWGCIGVQHRMIGQDFYHRCFFCSSSLKRGWAVWTNRLITLVICVDFKESLVYLHTRGTSDRVCHSLPLVLFRGGKVWP